MNRRDEFASLSPYTFGTMSLGRHVADLDHDVRIARAAMETGVWFHTSQEYGGGGTFMVLRHAFDEARAQVPRMQFKIRCDSADTIRFDVHDALRRLGIERIDIAQLCRDTHDHREVVDDFRRQGPMYEACQQLREQGLVGRFAFEIFPGFAGDALKAMRQRLFDAAIFYYNPVQRNAPPAVWQAIRDSGAPILALRTLGKVTRPPAEEIRLLERNRKPDSAERLRQLQPVFEQSGCASWPAFCVRFALSVPGVKTTIGGTANLDHFHELRAAAEQFEPLPDTILEQVHALHERWG
ncbi:MAG: aldo/keto reductase [Phycisphaeraceae bacterium]